MFEHDRSAARGQMATRGLYLFKHDSELGNAPAHSLFERLHVARKPDVAIPRRFDDYAVDFDGRTLGVGETCSAGPGVELIRRW